MRLTVFNGSPRGQGQHSNTKILLESFREGFSRTAGNTWENAFLARHKEHAQHLEMFAQAEVVLLAMPLYFDFMPAPMKLFVEGLRAFVGRPNNPAILFLVQGGYPETTNTRPTQRYLERLATRLGCEYLGTIATCGIETIQGTLVPASHESTRWHIKAPWVAGSVIRDFQRLGEHFGDTGKLDPKQLKRIARPEQYRGLKALFYRYGGLWAVVLLFNAYMLAYGAYKKRLDRPLLRGDGDT